MTADQRRLRCRHRTVRPWQETLRRSPIAARRHECLKLAECFFSGLVALRHHGIEQLGQHGDAAGLALPSDRTAETGL